MHKRCKKHSSLETILEWQAVYNIIRAIDQNVIKLKIPTEVNNCLRHVSLNCKRWVAIYNTYSHQDMHCKGYLFKLRISTSIRIWSTLYHGTAVPRPYSQVCTNKIKTNMNSPLARKLLTQMNGLERKKWNDQCLTLVGYQFAYDILRKQHIVLVNVILTHLGVTTSASHGVLWIIWRKCGVNTIYVCHWMMFLPLDRLTALDSIWVDSGELIDCTKLVMIEIMLIRAKFNTWCLNRWHTVDCFSVIIHAF